MTTWHFDARIVYGVIAESREHRIEQISRSADAIAVQCVEETATEQDCPAWLYARIMLCSAVMCVRLALTARARMREGRWVL